MKTLIASATKHGVTFQEMYVKGKHYYPTTGLFPNIQILDNLPKKRIDKSIHADYIGKGYRFSEQRKLQIRKITKTAVKKLDLTEYHKMIELLTKKEKEVSKYTSIIVIK